MSTLRVSAINNASASTGGLAFSTGGNVTGAGMDLVVPSSVANSGGSVTVTGGQVAFSGVTSVSLNGCFTSGWENYRILLVLTSIPSVDISFRGRTSGADNTTSNYAGATQWHNGSAWTLTRDTSAQSQLKLIANASIGFSGLFMALDVYTPQLNSVTSIAHFNASNITHQGSGWFSTSTQFDGFSIYPASSTITGTIRVYGYRNA